VLPGALTARLIEQFRSRASGHGVMLEDGRHVELTAREHDVLVLLADEVPTSEMASRLFLFPGHRPPAGVDAAPQARPGQPQGGRPDAGPPFTAAIQSPRPIPT
jgi:hypothetical protein